MEENQDFNMPICRRLFTRRKALRWVLIVLVILSIAMPFHLSSLLSRASQSLPVYDPNHPFITMDASDTRRLGNMIFCYASMIGIAMTNNMSAIMPASSRLNDIFKIKVPVVKDIEYNLGPFEHYVEFGHRGSAYDFNTRRLNRKNTKLFGYLQSWMYYEHRESQIKDHLRFHDDISERANTFLKSVTNDKTIIRIGVHARRGDMMDEYFKNFGYVTPPADYYATAMKYFENKFKDDIIFIVCSDDIEWAKKNIQGKSVVYSTGHSDSEDLCILSLCNHTVVSVGSFGWWGAFLAGGTTVFYDKWPKEYSRLEYHVDKRSYFPPDWVPLH